MHQQPTTHTQRAQFLSSTFDSSPKKDYISKTDIKPEPLIWFQVNDTPVIISDIITVIITRWLHARVSSAFKGLVHTHVPTYA